MGMPFLVCPQFSLLAVLKKKNVEKMHELKWHNVTLEHNFTSVQEKGRMLIVSQRSVIRAQVRPDGVTSGASHR